MGTAKILPLSTLKQTVGMSGKQYTEVPWHATRFVVRRFLSIQEVMTVIQRIIDGACDHDGNILIGLLDFSIRLSIVTAYALVELPTDADELYYVLYGSDLYDTVCKNVNRDQIDMIKNAVQRYVELSGNIRAT